MYIEFFDGWMAMSWEERRRKAREMPVEVLECFAGAFECEAKMLRLGHAQSLKMAALRAWQEQRAKEVLQSLMHGIAER